MPQGIRIVIAIFLVLAFAAGASSEESVLRIIHVNDFHGFAEPHKPIGSQVMLGGAAYLATAVNRLRQQRPSLLLSAGDMIQGNTWANFSKGKSVIELMNALHFDAMSIGNHEFDFGQAVLRDRISGSSFPILAANVLGLAGSKPYVVIRADGVKIGIIGVIAEDTPVLTNPNNVTGLVFQPVRETVEKYLPEVRREADIVIVLSHIGHAADRLLAQEVKGIDFIVGGHSHTKVVAPPVVGETMILQAWEHGKAVGVLDIVYGKGKVISAAGYLEEIRPEGSADKDIEAIVLKHKGVVDSALDQRIGETATDLDGENVRRVETNLGNLIADVVREVSGAKAALINSGAIRTSIRKGEIKAKDVYSAVPFDNYVIAVKLKGAQILKALEHGFAAAEKGVGAFPQVSGISLKYDLSAPPGSRIREVRLGGNPIDPAREYTLATLDFIAAGGDGYKAFADAIQSSTDYAAVGGAVKGDQIAYSDPGRWLRDLVIDYIRSHKLIAPRVEGRMVWIEK